MSDEITRLLDAAKTAASDLDDATRRRIVRAVLLTLDELIDENDEDSIWPDRDDLGLLAADL